MQIYQLVLELGRQCNMRCEHCLRGEAQDLSITEEIIDAALNDVSYISDITLTGGEPLLYGKEMKMIVDKIKEKDIQVGCFFVATNGSIMSDDFIMAMIRLYDWSEDKECCHVSVSQDQFHNDAEYKDIFKAFSFYSDMKEYEDRDINNLIKMGRSADNFNWIKDYRPTTTLEYDNDDGLLIESTVYVSSNGNVVFDCDTSYDYIDNNNVGTVSSQSSLKDVIENWISKWEEGECIA